MYLAIMSFAFVHEVGHSTGNAVDMFGMGYDTTSMPSRSMFDDYINPDIYIPEQRAWAMKASSCLS